MVKLESSDLWFRNWVNLVRLVFKSGRKGLGTYGCRCVQVDLEVWFRKFEKKTEEVKLVTVVVENNVISPDTTEDDEGE